MMKKSNILPFARNIALRGYRMEYPPENCLRLGNIKATEDQTLMKFFISYAKKVSGLPGQQYEAILFRKNERIILTRVIMVVY